MYSSNSIITSNQERSNVEIFLSGRALNDLDIFSKSDPYVRVYFKRAPNTPWALLGRTQTVDNNLNPNFTKSFIVDYIFQAKQELKFEVMDQDDKLNASNDEFIGAVQTTLGSCVGAREQTSILNLSNKQNNKPVGKLIVRVQPVNNTNKYIRMKWAARKLTNTDSYFDFWDKSDPYLKFLKIRNDNTLIEAGRTITIMENLNPSWPLVDMAESKLIKQTSSEKIKIECWDWEEAGQAKHQFIGQIYVTLSQLCNMKTPAQFTLENLKQKKPGFIILQKLEVYTRPTFIDYLRGGLQLNLAVAIDFTGSNGIPTQPTSLHYIDPYKPNQYQTAIMAVGNILMNYDYDKKIPAFGFGAKLNFPLMKSNTVSHCFLLSGNPNELEAQGLESLMNMYARSLVNVSLSGPTYFAPIIREFIDLASQSMQEGSYSYQVLLILTDGQIHDMDQTVDLIVNYSHLPLSIIIVGVGNADFSNMDRLDGDNGLYNHQGKKAIRDIVQFVPFNQVKLNPDLLAKQLLAELPDQVVQYMLLSGKVPNKPVEINMQNLMMPDVNSEEIQVNLKKNLPNLFEGLALGPNPYI